MTDTLPERLRAVVDAARKWVDARGDVNPGEGDGLAGEAARIYTLDAAEDVLFAAVALLEEPIPLAALGGRDDD